MTPLRRFASSPLKVGRTWWPGEAGSTGALAKALPVFSVLFLAVVLVAPVVRLLVEGFAPGAADGAEPLR